MIEQRRQSANEVVMLRSKQQYEDKSLKHCRIMVKEEVQAMLDSFMGDPLSALGF